MKWISKTLLAPGFNLDRFGDLDHTGRFCQIERTRCKEQDLFWHHPGEFFLLFVKSHAFLS